MKKERYFSCKGLKSLIIADPMYLDELLDVASAEHKKSLLSLIFQEKVPSGFKGKYSVAENHVVTEDGFEFDEIVVFLALARDMMIGKEKLVDILTDNRLIKGNEYLTVSNKEAELGCDTACFIMQTDRGFDEFHTGADGYYGDCVKMAAALAGEKKKLWGYAIRISLDADLFDVEDVAASLDCVFGL